MNSLALDNHPYADGEWRAAVERIELLGGCVLAVRHRGDRVSHHPLAVVQPGSHRGGQDVHAIPVRQLTQPPGAGPHGRDLRAQIAEGLVGHPDVRLEHRRQHPARPEVAVQIDSHRGQAEALVPERGSQRVESGLRRADVDVVGHRARVSN